MNQVVGQIRQLWARSRAYRVILVIAVVYTVFRLAVHGAYLAVMLLPNQNIMGGVPGWVEADGSIVPNDLQDYLDASARLQNRQDLYLKGTLDRVEFYQYAPAYALAFTPFLWLSPAGVTIFHTLLHIGAYVLLYVWWWRIFYKLGLEQGQEMLIWTLPIWLIFPDFWSDLGYLNIYIIMALLGTLLIEAILNEHLAWSLIWLSIILQAKPQWAFAAAVPLLLGRYRFFLKLLIATIVIYFTIMVITILAIGPYYGWQQYVSYAQFLQEMPGNFPWRGPDTPFLGYNHSIKQAVVYLLGVTSSALHLATGIKVLLLLPLVVISTRYSFQPIGCPGRFASQLALDFAFALYLGAFIWLDVVWELSLGIAVFTYLLATLRQRWAKALVWGVFTLYSLVDPMRTLGGVLAVFDMNTILPGLYIVTDPSIYVPVVMIVTLTFYALLVKRLWTADRPRAGSWRLA